MSERGEGRLKKYRRKRQKLLLSLLLGPKDPDTTAFNALSVECVNPKPTRKPGKDWMSKAMWHLIAKRASLMRSGRIWQDTARRMKREIEAAIKAGKRKLTAKVGDSIVSEVAKGDIKEAFRHLKGWYRKAAETQARPCQQTMEHQTNKREDLCAERAAYGEAFPAMGCPTPLAAINQLKRAAGCGFPAEPRTVWGHLGDKSEAHQSMAQGSKEGRRPGDDPISRWGW